MLVTYKNLTIRNACATDAELLSRWWNDGAVMAHAGFPDGLGTTPEIVTDELSGNSDESGRVLIIEADGVPVGEMSYGNQGGGCAEIGIKICDFSAQGKGYGPIFLKMLIGELFSMGYEKIILDTNLKNTRAQHVYEKLGFTKLRVNIGTWTDQLGEPQDSVDYEMLRPQFTPLEA